MQARASSFLREIFQQHEVAIALVPQLFVEHFDLLVAYAHLLARILASFLEHLLVLTDALLLLYDARLETVDGRLRRSNGGQPRVVVRSGHHIGDDLIRVEDGGCGQPQAKLVDDSIASQDGIFHLADLVVVINRFLHARNRHFLAIIGLRYLFHQLMLYLRFHEQIDIVANDAQRLFQLVSNGQ